MVAPARFVGRMAIVNLAIAAVITMSFADLRVHTPLRYALQQFAISFLITSCISPACVLLLPKIAPPVFTRFSFPENWLILVTFMFAVAAAGSLLALVILAGIGYLSPGKILAAWFNNALKVSVIVTLTLGISMTARGIMRNRLKTATIALRTKERDEAEARRIATEAQLASLESRVQPHFLFNTLNSIAALIPKDPAGAERMTGQLASLLRSALDSAATPVVTLDRELKIVTDYLDIERVRFGERLRYEIHVEPELRQMPVPRLSLQTLVENSVKYAVSPSRTGASIRVRATRLNATLSLAVEDDGPGVTVDAEMPGHGLALLRERLRMTCGESATFTIGREDGLTIARIEIQPLDPRILTS